MRISFLVHCVFSPYKYLNTKLQSWPFPFAGPTPKHRFFVDLKSEESGKIARKGDEIHYGWQGHNAMLSLTTSSKFMQSLSILGCTSYKTDNNGQCYDANDCQAKFLSSCFILISFCLPQLICSLTNSNRSCFHVCLD